MRHVIFSLAIVFGGTITASAAEEGDRTAQVDRAIERGLDTLQVMQDKREGCWRDRNNRPNPAVTGLAVMAFLSAGHVPGEGRYGAVVEKGIRWVLRKQQPNGLVRHRGPSGNVSARHRHAHACRGGRHDQRRVGPGHSQGAREGGARHPQGTADERPRPRRLALSRRGTSRAPTSASPAGR